MEAWSIPVKSGSSTSFHIRAWEFYLRVFYNTSETCCFLPISWDSQTNSLKFGKSQVRVVIWAIFLTYYLMDTSYLAITICTVKYGDLSVDDTLKLLSHALSRIGAGCLIMGYSFNFKSTIDVLNQVCKLHHKLKVTYYGDAYALINDGMLYVTFGTITVHIQPFGPSLQHFQERQSVRYWGSRLLPQELYNSPLGIGLCGFGECLVCFFAIFGTGYAATQLVVYSQTTRHWLGVLQKHTKSGRLMNDIPKQLKLYRMLYVLNCVHNEACSKMIWPIAQDVLLVVHTLCNVLTIKCFFVLPLPIRAILVLSAVAFTFFESSCLKAAADIYEISKIFCDGICAQRQKRHRIVGRSLRCLRIQVASAYFFKMSTFNTFMKSVVDNTVNVMLTFFQEV